MDNNPIDNAIRPIALGRKNWLFPGSHTAGKKRAAAIMSLLATAKTNGIEPHAWLTDVDTRLPTTLDRDIDSRQPMNWKPLPLARGGGRTVTWQSDSPLSHPSTDVAFFNERRISCGP